MRILQDGRNLARELTDCLAVRAEERRSPSPRLDAVRRVRVDDPLRLLDRIQLRRRRTHRPRQPLRGGGLERRHADRAAPVGLLGLLRLVARRRLAPARRSHTLRRPAEPARSRLLRPRRRVHDGVQPRVRLRPVAWRRGETVRRARLGPEPGVHRRQLGGRLSRHRVARRPAEVAEHAALADSVRAARQQARDGAYQPLTAQPRDHVAHRLCRRAQRPQCRQPDQRRCCPLRAAAAAAAALAAVPAQAATVAAAARELEHQLLQAPQPLRLWSVGLIAAATTATGAGAAAAAAPRGGLGGGGWRHLRLQRRAQRGTSPPSRRPDARRGQLGERADRPLHASRAFTTAVPRSDGGVPSAVVSAVRSTASAGARSSAPASPARNAAASPPLTLSAPPPSLSAPRAATRIPAKGLAPTICASRTSLDRASATLARPLSVSISASAVPPAHGRSCSFSIVAQSARGLAASSEPPSVMTPSATGVPGLSTGASVAATPANVSFAAAPAPPPHDSTPKKALSMLPLSQSASCFFVGPPSDCTDTVTPAAESATAYRIGTTAQLLSFIFSRDPGSSRFRSVTLSSMIPASCCGRASPPSLTTAAAPACTNVANESKVEGVERVAITRRKCAEEGFAATAVLMKVGEGPGLFGAKPRGP
eukprot:7391759-Prymnesium_polylepis.1